MIGTNLAITTKNYANAGGAVAYDADALAYFTANTAITSDADKNAINTFYLGLKSDGIYTKIKAMYLPIWGSATACKWNLVNPLDTNAAFRLTFTTGWTYSSGGITPTNAYANTFLTPSTNFNNTTFNHLSYYSRTNSAVAFEYVMGSSATGSMSMIIRRDNNLGYGFADYVSGTTYRGASGSVTNSLGLFTFLQKGTTAKLFKNNTIVASNTFATSNLTLSTNTIVLGAVNDTASVNGYTNKQCSFSSIGEGLTDAEASNLYSRVNTLMTYFGINVY